MPESATTAPTQPQFNYNYPNVVPGQGGPVPGPATGGGAGATGAAGGGSPQTAGAAFVGNLDADVHSVV